MSKACYIQLNYKYKTNSWTTEYSCKGNNKIRSPVHLMFWVGFYCLVILRRSFEWNLNSCLNKHYQVKGKEEKKKNHVSTWKDKNQELKMLDTKEAKIGSNSLLFFNNKMLMQRRDIMRNNFLEFFSFCSSGSEGNHNIKLLFVHWGTIYMKKSCPGRRVTCLPKLTWASRHFLTKQGEPCKWETKKLAQLERRPTYIVAG